MWRFLLRHEASLMSTTRVVRRKFTLLAFIILSICCLAGFSSAQTVQQLQGIVRDAISHLPVINASIHIQNTSYQSVVDQFGRFALINLPTGTYDLVITASGYQSDTLNGISIIADQPTSITISLTPEPYELPTITVTDTFVQKNFDGRVILSKEYIAQSNVTTLAQLLTTVPNLLVQEAGQQVTVSMRGGEKRHVVVLLDGHKLNASGDNIANLASVPVSQIERIEIIPGGSSAESGSGAIAGVIDIITHADEITSAGNLSFQRGWGSWQKGWYEANIQNPILLHGFSYHFTYRHQGSVGDFPFNYSVAPRPTVYSGSRINNGLSADNYFLNAEMALPKKIMAQINGQHYEAESGLPGRVSAQNEQASRADKRRTLGIQLKTKFSPAITLNTALSGSRLQQHFINRESGATGFETKYINDLYRFSSTVQLRLFSYSQLQSGIEAQGDEIDGQDIMRPAYGFGKAHRTAVAWFASARHSLPLGMFAQLHPLAVDAAIRYDRAQTGDGELFTSDGDSAHTTAQWSPKVGAGIGVGSKLYMTLYGNYGHSFSLPDLYSLFWKGDVRSQGNPYLRPERAEHSEFNLRTGYEHRLVTAHIGLTYFHSTIQDLILWIAGFADVWRPENIAGARITGTERSAEIRIYNNLLQLSISNTEILPLNRTPGLNSYNKDLTYRPRSITKTSARINWLGCYVSYAIRWVDKSYALPSNTRWYEGYRIDDLAFGGEKVINDQWNIHADLRVDNLRDQSYVLVQHFPMPGREWQIGIGIDYLINQRVTKNLTDK